MPSWKKIIVSGSDASLNSLYAPSITGSLQGTSSFAVTASYALTSSFSLATTENRILVINKSGNTITKGVVVHLTGSTNSSDTPYITTASYESDGLSANTLGIASETIAFNSTGYVTTEGVLTGLNITGFVAGQVVYLGATGSIIGSAPLAPLHSVRLGQVVRDSPVNNGSIYVRIDNGYELGELHDITDTTTTSSYGDLLVKSGSVWINSRQLTGSYGLTGSLTVTGSTTTDLVRITQTGTGNAFVVEDSNNPDATPFRIDANGQTMIGTTASFGPLTVRGNGATGVTIDVDGNASSEWQSTRLFFKITGSASGLDTSIRNVSGSFLFSTLATANGSSGTAAMAISASGDVGIGTTGPGASLHLFRTSDPNLLIIERNAAANAPVRYKNTIGSMYAGLSTSASFAVGTSTDLMNASTTFLTVSASGNVGIGTTTPSAKLHVNNTTTGNSFLVEDSSNPDTTPFVIDASGKVGIGTTTPAAQLEIKSNAQNNIGGLLLRASGSSNYPALIYETTNEAGVLELYSGSALTTRLYANGYSYFNGGNVGIGLNNPSSPLHVRNTAIPGDAEIIAQFDVSDDSSYFRIRNATGANSTFIPTLQGYNSSDKIAMYFLADGVTDTGTDPLLNHDVRINNAEVVTRPLYRWSNFGNIKMIMLANGNVGIGTETPLANLHTTGSAIISSSMVIGSSSLGPNENTLTLGARDTSAEGGQIGFNAPGGTYTSASFIDNWQNKARILKGNNTTSTGLIAQWDIHTTQMQLPGYTAASSFPGTATANLAVDSGGNVITVSTAGGTVFPYTGNATITGSLTVTQPIYVPINGGMYFQGGDDAALYDINVSNHMGIYGVQDSTVASVKLGSGGGIISGKSGNIGIGINTPTATLHVNNTGSDNSFLVEDSANPDATPFVIDNSGKVGIGTTNPQYLFVASSSTSTDTIMFFDGGTSANSNLVAAADTSIKVPLLVLSDRTNSYLPSTSYFLGLDRSSTPNYASRNDAIYVNNYQDKGHYFITNNGGSKAVRMVISGSGNVGIGTTTPNAKLDVNGNAIITGSLSVTGITQGSYSNTVLIDTASGQLYYTASSAIGGTGLSGVSDYISYFDTNNSLSYTDLHYDGKYTIGYGSGWDNENYGKFGIYNTSTNPAFIAEGYQQGGIFLTRGSNTGMNYALSATAEGSTNVGNTAIYAVASGVSSSNIGGQFTATGGTITPGYSGYSNLGLYIASDSSANIGTDVTNSGIHITVTGRPGDAKYIGQFSDGSEGVGKVLTCISSTGLATWQTPTGGSSFPYTGSAQITGSLGITGSLSIGQSLNASTTTTANIGSTTIYSVSTSSYDGAWFEYTARSGSNARAGQIMSIWHGSAVNFTETTTTDFGSTSGLSLGVFIVNGAMALTASADTNGWNIKTIVRSI